MFMRTRGSLPLSDERVKYNRAQNKESLLKEFCVCSSVQLPVLCTIISKKFSYRVSVQCSINLCLCSVTPATKELASEDIQIMLPVK